MYIAYIYHMPAAQDSLKSSYIYTAYILLIHIAI